MRTEQGFTYLGLLLAIALIGLGLTAAAEVWVTTANRQRMEQLQFAGQQFVQAIGSYYASSPGGRREFPKGVDDLLEDKRFPFVRRHLRRNYINPFTGQSDWELIPASGGGFIGVRGRWSSPLGGEPIVREFVYSPLP